MLPKIIEASNSLFEEVFWTVWNLKIPYLSMHLKRLFTSTCKLLPHSNNNNNNNLWHHSLLFELTLKNQFLHIVAMFCHHIGWNHVDYQLESHFDIEGAGPKDTSVLLLLHAWPNKPFTRCYMIVTHTWDPMLLSLAIYCQVAILRIIQIISFKFSMFRVKAW